jgi:hypothetical protein
MSPTTLVILPILVSYIIFHYQPADDVHHDVSNRKKCMPKPVVLIMLLCQWWMAGQ